MNNDTRQETQEQAQGAVLAGDIGGLWRWSLTLNGVLSAGGHQGTKADAEAAALNWLRAHREPGRRLITGAL